MDLILGKLDELQAIGIKQVTLDDGWYVNAGEWNLNPQKLPNGSADMKLLTDAIHARGMTALLWWRPCDGGRESSSLYKEHPEYFVQNQNGTKGKLAGPGQSDRFNGTTGYALCPSSEGAIQSQIDFAKKALEEWGFDGLKSDYVWSIPKCYNPAHHHERPEESTENQAVFYREVYQAMRECNKDAFHLLCNCGTPQDFYSLPYVTQIPTADPTSVDQTRRRVKAYKALCGDYFPVTTDHNEIWYPSTIGTGAVLIEKRNMTGANQQEYERWLQIAAREELHKGDFIGDLYSYGFDPYETYVVHKDGVMYYAFYRDGAKYRPVGNPDIELKGLNPNRMYRITDYINNRVIATNIPGDQAVFSETFSNYLLLKAEELTQLDPIASEVRVQENDARLVYEGNWTAEQNSAFSDGQSKYTQEALASVTMQFQGTSIAWYGQKDTNFGSAQVYIDGSLEAEVTCTGQASSGVKLFEKTGLENGAHTFKIVCKSPVIDLDYLVYAQETDGSDEAAQTLASVASSLRADQFSQNAAWEDFTRAEKYFQELLSDESSDEAARKQAKEQLLDTLPRLRKAVRKDLIGSAPTVAPVPEDTPKDLGMLYHLLLSAETLDMQHVIPVIRTQYENALEHAWKIWKDPNASQNEINQAWAALLDAIQYADYTKGDKTSLTALVESCQKISVSLYQSPENFEQARREACLLLSDENALDYEIRQALDRLSAEKSKLVKKPTEQTPAAVKNLRAKSQQKNLTVTWDAQPSASSYTVYINKGKAWSVAGTTSQTSLKIKKLTVGKKYQIKVTASNKSGTGKESDILYTATCPAKPKLKKVVNYKSTGLKIFCKKNGVSGFEAWVKKGKKPYKKAASGSSKIILKKGIRTNAKVSVKVRAYLKTSGKQKVYSPFRKVTFKK